MSRRFPLHIFRRTVRPVLIAFFWVHAHTAQGNSTIFAYKQADRLNGAPPTREKFAEIVGLVNQGKFDEAGKVAFDDPSGKFYKIILRNVFTRWTNREQSPRSRLNDVVATAIGKGSKSLGELIASSQAFAVCMAETAIETMYSREDNPSISVATVDRDRSSQDQPSKVSRWLETILLERI